MKIELIEQNVPKKTVWGTVEKSLNQHIVLIENDEKKMVQCGYVGVNSFLPLSGFPQELCEEVAVECSKQLDRKVAAGIAPPSLTQLAMMIAESKAVEPPELDGEDE